MADSGTSQNEKKKPEKKVRFARQLVLISDIQRRQDECSHILDLRKDVITCEQCGAIWWRE